MKATKAAADYEQTSNRPYVCANCTMYESPSSCTKVAGNISPKAVCRYFEPKKAIKRTIVG